MAERRSNPLYSEVSPVPGRPYTKGGWRDAPEIVHDTANIKGFFGEYRWLSNFGSAIVVMDGVTYTSVEKAYQAAKWQSADRQFFVTCTNEEAITYNRIYTPNGCSLDTWDGMKVDVMEFLLRQKFDASVNTENAERLLATGDKYIEETNWWNDTFWGKNLQGEGSNHLGELLMRIRRDLRAVPE